MVLLPFDKLFYLFSFGSLTAFSTPLLQKRTLDITTHGIYILSKWISWLTSFATICVSTLRRWTTHCLATHQPLFHPFTLVDFITGSCNSLFKLNGQLLDRIPAGTTFPSIFPDYRKSCAFFYVTKVQLKIDTCCREIFYYSFSCPRSHWCDHKSQCSLFSSVNSLI